MTGTRPPTCVEADVEQCGALLVGEQELLRIVGEDADSIDTLVDHAVENAALTFEVDRARLGERRGCDGKDPGERFGGGLDVETEVDKGLSLRWIGWWWERVGRRMCPAQPISMSRVVWPTRHEPTLRLSTPRPRTTHDSVRAPVVPRVRV